MSFGILGAGNTAFVFCTAFKWLLFIYLSLVVIEHHIYEGQECLLLLRDAKSLIKQESRPKESKT